MKKKNHDLLIIFPLIILVFLIAFPDQIITYFTLLPFNSLSLNALIFAEPCGEGKSPAETGCYDADSVDGSDILNCLHGGACPIGVSYEPDEVSNTVTTNNEQPKEETITSETTNEVKTDTDGDGIFNDVDKCVFEPETFNGFSDTNGCPETYANTSTDTNSITQLVSITSTEDCITNFDDRFVFDGEQCVFEPTGVQLSTIVINPPNITANTIQTESKHTSSNINLNGMINSWYIFYIILIFTITITIIILLIKKYKK